MQTLKTAIVVVLLLVVFYGVYEMLNRPPGKVPPSVAVLPAEAMGEVDIDFGDPTGLDGAPSFDAAPSDTPGGNLITEFPEPPASDSNNAPPGPPESTLPAPPGGAFVPPSTPSLASGPAFPPAAASTATLSAGAPSTPPQGTAASIAMPDGGRLMENPWVNQEIVPTTGTRAYQSALQLARSQMENQEYHQALEGLSVFYKSPDLTAEQHRELLDLLDPLAASVVYSREHLVERPYRVGRNETLMDIAQQYNVPYQLLQKINAIENPNVLLPGSELKVLPGPFRAEVDLQAQELTIFLGPLYAGRFPVTLGADPEPLEGEFQVRDKQVNKTYFSMDGRTIPAGSPANPFGNIWLDLGREVCIHGSPMEGGDRQRGCISLSPRDANDVYSILSLGSRVRILR